MANAHHSPPPDRVRSQSQNPAPKLGLIYLPNVERIHMGSPTARLARLRLVPSGLSSAPDRVRASPQPDSRFVATVVVFYTGCRSGK
jgi:hypothetical protein